MDKLIVRLVIIITTIYMAVSFIFAWMGIDLYQYDSLFFPSLINGVLLTTLCHAQGRYHCVYMRGLCYNMILTPSLIFIDYQYNIFDSALESLIILSVLWIIFVSSTLLLAIRHFRKIKNLNRKRNEIYKANR